MKSIVAISIILNTLFSSYHDIPESEVPSVVKNTFQTTFSNTTGVEWEKQNNVYLVEFEVNSIDHTAYIDSTGKLLKVKSDVEVNALPKAVVSAIKKEYQEYTIDDADKLEQSGKTTYIIELEKGLTDYKVIYSPEGKLLEKHTELD